MEKLYQLSDSYNAIWLETSQLYEAWARQRGISFYELLVILSITEADGKVLQKDICQRVTIPKQTVNTVIKTLIRKGWLELEVSEQDRRSRNLCLTAEGRENTAQIVQELQNHEAQVWLQLGLDRAEHLIEYTALYNRYFREVSDKNARS